MDVLIQKLLDLLLSGGPSAIIALLILIVVGLLFDRHRMVKSSTERDKKIEDIVEKYHKGNIDLHSAFSELKNLLHLIKDRITR